MINYWKWVGHPYQHGGRDLQKGIDCWGLVVEFYKQEYDIQLPIYPAISLSSYTPSQEEVSVNSDNLLRTELYQISTKKEIAEEGDILLFNVGGRPLHIAIAIDQELMLHADRNVGSVIENYRSNKWQSRLHEIISLR